MNVEATRTEIGEKIAKHSRFVLQFSGGKDSLCVLHLLKPWWNRLIVVWGDPGDGYEEERERVAKECAGVAEFRVANGHAKEWQAKALPSDIVPARSTAIGIQLQPESGAVPLVSRHECCAANMWVPIMRETHATGASLIIRGQRTTEQFRNNISSGTQDISGAEIYFPIRDWTQADVLQFLKDEGVQLPKYYEYVDGSLYCKHCTAYQDTMRGKLAYLSDFHPQAAREYERRMEIVRREISIALNTFIEGVKEIGNPVKNPLVKK